MTASERSLRVLLTSSASSSVSSATSSRSSEDRLPRRRADARKSGADAVGGEVDVVVQATEGALPRGELAAIRADHAPIVLLVEKPDASIFNDALYADVADIVVLPAPAARRVRWERSAGADGAVSADHPRTRHCTVFSPKGGTAGRPSP